MTKRHLDHSGSDSLSGSHSYGVTTAVYSKPNKPNIFVVFGYIVYIDVDDLVL